MDAKLLHLRTIGRAVFKETKDLLDPWISYAEFKESVARRGLFFEQLRRMPMVQVHELAKVFPKAYQEQLVHELQMYIMFDKGQFTCNHLWRNFADVKKKCCIKCKVEEDLNEDVDRGRGHNEGRQDHVEA